MVLNAELHVGFAGTKKALCITALVVLRIGVNRVALLAFAGLLIVAMMRRAERWLAFGLLQSCVIFTGLSCYEKFCHLARGPKRLACKSKLRAANILI
ncbi:hypothetical protein [Rhizobium mayense]|uniref:Uncharacterized protein n=1 Tax=Rhizobium mayense TaxID=1312184 RepID=A0ABT7JTF5_9HYPH|nr:hypothetical protein [Rhizobium mayense]MDL2398438.1 hypothetical protein [Rhizobium mayense]